MILYLCMFNFIDMYSNHVYGCFYFRVCQPCRDYFSQNWNTMKIFRKSARSVFFCVGSDVSYYVFLQIWISLWKSRMYLLRAHKKVEFVLKIYLYIQRFLNTFRAVIHLYIWKPFNRLQPRSLSLPSLFFQCIYVASSRSTCTYIFFVGGKNTTTNQQTNNMQHSSV